MIRAALGAVTWSLASAASAQFEVTVGYADLEHDRIEVGAMVAGAGFRLPVTDAISITPSVRAGVGVRDDEFATRSVISATGSGEAVTVVTEERVEINEFYGMQLQGRFGFSNGTYLFVVPSYTFLDLASRRSGYRHKDRGFNLGAGAGIRFSDIISAEFSYEKMGFASVDVLNIQVRFNL